MILLQCPKCLHHWKMEKEILAKEAIASCPHCQAAWRITPRKPRAHTAVVAETDRVFSRFLADTLVSMGFHVRALENGRELQAAIAQEPDLVVANVFLPEKLGVDVCEEIKRDERYHHIPFILIGSLFRAESYRRPTTNLYGADDYIEEGIAEEEFRGIVQRITGFGMVARKRPASPLEEQVRRQVRIHLEALVEERSNGSEVGGIVRSVVKRIIRDTPHLEPSLVEKIASEYLTGLEGDHD